MTAITALQQAAAREYTDSFKRAISLAASRTSALLWPLEDKLQFNADYYNSICSGLPNIAFSKNPVSLKRDESIVVLIEIDLALQMKADISPSENLQNIFAALKQKSEILFKNLNRSRNYSGAVVVVGTSSDKHISLKTSQIANCFETPETQIYYIDGHMDADLGLPSAWNPLFMVSVGINAINDIEVLQYKALAFNTSEVTKIPVARELDAVSVDESVSDNLKPDALPTNEDDFPANPLFQNIEGHNNLPIKESDPASFPMSEAEVIAAAKKTIESDVKNTGTPHITSMSMHIHMEGKGQHLLVVDSNDGICSINPTSEPDSVVNLIWDDESYLAVDCAKLTLNRQDSFLSVGYGKIIAHLKNLNITSGDGTAFETNAGLELTFKDFVDAFCASCLTSDAISAAIEKAFK